MQINQKFIFKKKGIKLIKSNLIKNNILILN